MSTNLKISVDGPDGVDAQNGRPGQRGGTGCSGGHGQNANTPIAGRDAGQIDVFLKCSSDGQIVIEALTIPSSHAVSEPAAERRHHVLELDGTLDLSARGGRGGCGGRGGDGGMGGNGTRGKNATRHSSGGNGGPGGNGGDGGNGSSGTNGGEGGLINVHVSDKDSFLLMSVLNSDNPKDLIIGGRRGLKGANGRGGAGGAGGKGGKSYSYTDSDGNRHHNSGGSNGRSGHPGRHGRAILLDGVQGDDGLFTIVVDGSSLEQWAARYYLRLGNADVHSEQSMKKTSGLSFQFGDTIQVRHIVVKNVGGMISPTQESQIKVMPSTFISPLTENTAFLKQRVPPGVEKKVGNALSFHIPIPDIRAMGDCMEPLELKDRLHLSCAQLGNFSYCRYYSNFDISGKLMQLSFPVNNSKGFEGLRTIRPGDGMRIRYSVTNSSPHDIGEVTKDQRKLWVQFYRNPKVEFDISTPHVKLIMAGIDCTANLDENSSPSTTRGTIIPIKSIKSGETIELEGTLFFSPQIVPYSKIALQAEIVLQDLSGSNMSPIQRRQLQVATEPAYWPSKDNQIVLVSSSATTKEVFKTWSTLFADRLGLGIEYYSVSIYGSLDPFFQERGSGLTLKEAFLGKLVVVLDKEFNPLNDNVSAMNPSGMLPYGCQPQSSGFDASTKWLFVGSSKEAIRQLQNSHYAAQPTDANVYSSCGEYLNTMKTQIRESRAKFPNVGDEEIKDGRIQVSTTWRSQQVGYATWKVRRFLEHHDPLRQYIIEVKARLRQNSKTQKQYKEVVVRRGYNRISNAAFVLEGDALTRHSNDSALLATVLSLPYQTLIDVFSQAMISKDSKLLEGCLDAFVRALLWDISIVLDGKFDVTNDVLMNDAFLSLSTLAQSEQILDLVNEGQEDAKIKISKLLGRLFCVASSPDLKPQFRPFSRKRLIQNFVTRMLDSLEQKWSSGLVPNVMNAEKEELQNAMEDYLLQNHSTCFGTMAFPGIKSRSRKSLAFLCSHRNQNKYDAPYGTFPLIEMSQKGYETKLRSVCPQKIVANSDSSRDKCARMRATAGRQTILSRELLSSIQATRDREEIRHMDMEVKL